VGTHAFVRLVGTQDDLVANSGTISGTVAALDLGGGNDTLRLDTGSVIGGLADGGDGFDTLEVLGTVTLPRPDPKPGEVLVRIRATTVTAGDYRARSLDMPPGFGLVGRLVFGLFRPRRQVLGAEFSGVAALGVAHRRALSHCSCRCQRSSHNPNSSSSRYVDASFH